MRSPFSTEELSQEVGDEDCTADADTNSMGEDCVRVEEEDEDGEETLKDDCDTEEGREEAPREAVMLVDEHLSESALSVDTLLHGLLAVNSNCPAVMRIFFTSFPFRPCMCIFLPPLQGEHLH